MSARRLVRRGTRVVCGLSIAAGSLLAALALVAAVVVAAVWMLRSSLGGNPHFQQKAAFRVAAMPAERDPGLLYVWNAADAPRPSAIAMESNPALDALVFDAKLAGATGSRFILSEPQTIGLARDERRPDDGLVPPPTAVAAVSVAVQEPTQAIAAAAQVGDITHAIPASVDPAVDSALPLPRSRPAMAASARDAVDAGRTRLALAPSGLNPLQPDSPAPLPDSRTAVYDIAGRTVYLPNGLRLEAHSGYGEKMDDPRYVHVRMRGPTPPNVYRLTMREKLFHGVQAIRLNPLDENRMFGRDGMLAHTYLLGPTGQSHGCVSFKDYPKFLRAFQRGEIDRLVVVSRLGNESWQTVSARNSSRRRYADNTQ